MAVLFTAALSLQLVARVALGAGSYLGALSVGAPLVTLYGRINKTLQTKPRSPEADLCARLNHQLNSKSNLSHTFAAL